MYPPAEGASSPTPEVEPTTEESASQLNPPYITIPITEEQISDWFKEINRAKDRRKKLEGVWTTLLEEYVPKVERAGIAENVKTNSHFRNTHTKLANVFFKSPELQLTARGPMHISIPDPQTGMPLMPEDVIAVKKALLNKKLGIDGVDAARLMDEVLFDCYQWAGVCAVKVGYENRIKTIMEPVLMPDPMWVPPPIAPGSVLGLSGADAQPPMVPMMEPDPMTGEPKPVTQPKEVVVWENWYSKKISTKKLLFDPDLTTGRIDEDACWIGHEMFLKKAQIKAQFGFDVTDAKGGSDTQLVLTKQDVTGQAEDKYHLYELFVRASEYDENEVNPEIVYQLVLMEGETKKALVYRPSPDQTIDEQGRLTPNSLVGYPIEVCYLRDMPDTPYIHSDAAFVNPQVKHLDTHLAQSVRLRDAAVAKMGYDEGALTADEVQNIKNMKVGDWLAFKEGSFREGVDKVVAQLTQPTASRDDYRLAASLKAFIDETLGISNATAGVPDDARRSATEVATTDTRAGARLGKDQQRATTFYLRWVRKFDTLLTRYMDEEDYVEIEGVDGARRLIPYLPSMLAGRWAYDMKPDSQLMIDASRDRIQTLTFYEKSMGDPRVNGFPILKRIASLFGMDPAHIIANPMMPTPGAGMPGEEAAGPPTGEREHVATGGRPNAPAIGQPPNVERPQ